MPSCPLPHPFLWILPLALPSFGASPAMLEEMEVQAPRHGESGVSPVADIIQQAVDKAPNAQLGTAPGVVFSLRGLTQEGLPTVGTRSNPALGVQYGGRSISTNELWIFGLPAWDSAPASIHYGPLLTVSGPAAEGGALIASPVAPAFADGGHAAVHHADYGTISAGLTGNLVLVPDRLALRLSGARNETDGTIRNITRDDDHFDRSRIDLFRSILRWQPAGDDRSVMDLQWEYARSEGNALGLISEVPDHDFYDRKTALDTLAEVSGDRHDISLSTRVSPGPDEWIEGDVTLHHLDGEQLADFDGGPFLDWFYVGTGDERRATGGLRWQKQTGGLSWTAGGYAERSDYDAAYAGKAFTIPGTDFHSGVQEDVTIAAVYASMELSLAGGWSASGGIRLDHQTRGQRSAAVLGGFPLGSGHSRVEETEWLPEVGILWKAESLEIGARLSRVYRPGGSAYAISLGQSQPYGAEKGWELELHAGKKWPRLELDGRIFHSSLTGQQVSYLAPGGTPILDQYIANSGESTRAGLELELEWRPAGELVAGLAGGYLFTEYDELSINGVDRSGQSFSHAPELMGNFRLGWMPARGWIAETVLSWMDGSFSQVDSPDLTGLGKRLLLSAKAGYRFDHLELHVFGTNLLDEDYALTLQDQRSVGKGITGKAGLPRCLGIGMEAEW